MRALLIAVAAVITLEAFALTVFPEGMKRLITGLSPRELQVAGFIELLVALALVSYIVLGGQCPAAT